MKSKPNGFDPTKIYKPTSMLVYQGESFVDVCFSLKHILVQCGPISNKQSICTVARLFCPTVIQSTAAAHLAQAKALTSFVCIKPSKVIYSSTKHPIPTVMGQADQRTPGRDKLPLIFFLFCVR